MKNKIHTCPFRIDENGITMLKKSLNYIYLYLWFHTLLLSPVDTKKYPENVTCRHVQSGSHPIRNRRRNHTLQQKREQENESLWWPKRRTSHGALLIFVYSTGPAENTRVSRVNPIYTEFAQDVRDTRFCPLERGRRAVYSAPVARNIVLKIYLRVTYAKGRRCEKA